MRAGPIGLWRFDDPRLLVVEAAVQGEITHRDPRCSAGAAAIAGAVALALRPGAVDARAFTAELAGWTQALHAPFAEHIEALGSYAALGPQRALERVLAAAAALGGQPDEWLGISPFVVPSVLWSLYSFLRAPDDYWEVMCTAIAVGGDVDTTAAMAGAISGARVGERALPDGLTTRLHDQGTWGRDELRGLAGRCREIMAGK